MTLRGDSPICPTCQCRFGSSDCAHFTNRGPNDPYYPEYILDDDADQLAECGPNGFGVFIPGWLRNPPAVCVSTVVQQPIGAETHQVLLFDREIYDTDNMHSTEDAGLMGRLVFNTSGIYFVSLNVSWTRTGSDDRSGDFAAYIWKNSEEFVAIDDTPFGDSDNFSSQCATYQGFFEAGEYVEAMVKHDIINTENEDDVITLAIAARTYPPRFAASFLRPAP